MACIIDGLELGESPHVAGTPREIRSITRDGSTRGFQIIAREQRTFAIWTKVVQPDRVETAATLTAFE